jgi:hypothetical protein
MTVYLSFPNEFLTETWNKPIPAPLVTLKPRLGRIIETDGQSPASKQVVQVRHKELCS